MKTKTLEFLAALIAFCGMVAAYADRHDPLAWLPPDLAHYWPMILGLAGVVLGCSRILGDYLDDGKLNGSFPKILVAGIMLFCLVFVTGCVNGRPAPWLNVRACYTLPDGTRVCGGVHQGNVDVTAELDTQGYAK